MKRLEQIIKLVSEYEKIDVNTLSEKLNVSKVTIRKDLDKLESKGLLHREHGYAVLNSGDDLNVRLSINYETKRKIVQEAVKLVSDNETIMIESGSTCALLANFVRAYDSCRVIVLGGEFQKDSQVTVGPLLKEMIQTFHVCQAFVGTDGYDKEMGFTGKDLMRSEVVQYISAVSDKVIVLTDSSKFDKRGTVRRFALSQVYEVITDEKLSKQNIATLENAGIMVKVVS